MIKRTIADKILKMIGGSKAIAMMGARQVGKSTLLKMMLGNNDKVLWLNGDDLDTQELLRDITSTRLRSVIGENRIVVIDEAQRITDIGLRMKLITDQMKDIQVIATGSSSLELSSKINEPLTGRKREFRIFPLTFQELANHTSLIDEIRMIPHRMVYGYYPEVVANPSDEVAALKELSNSYLYKDILSLDKVNKHDKLTRLVKALALQIGSQVSYNEIGSLIGLNPKTVEKYVDILEKCFIIFRLPCFSRNLRNELKTSRKIFFWDLGIRNAVIGNMAQIENRTDVGALWESFVIAERLKALAYQDSFTESWFWRTMQQQEIDYIEESNGKIQAFEFKWNNKKAKTKCPKTFADAYPDSEFKVITPDNIEEFLLF